jgi:hypothetical protein
MLTTIVVLLYDNLRLHAATQHLSTAGAF